MSGLSRNQTQAFELMLPLFRNGGSPSLSEIADAVGLASRSGAHRLVRELRKAGVITFIEGEQRSIQLVRASDRLREFSDTALLAEVERRGL